MQTTLDLARDVFSFIAKNELQAALSAIRKAAAIDPNTAEWRYHESLILLRLGHYRRGFKLYENRLRREGIGANRPRFTSAPWLGKERVAGKCLFIHAEQGLGDSIQFLRYAALAEARGARVIAGVPVELCNLATSVPGVSLRRSEPHGKVSDSRRTEHWTGLVRTTYPS